MRARAIVGRRVFVVILCCVVVMLCVCERFEIDDVKKDLFDVFVMCV